MKKLYYENPAHAWTEALPIGNGRLGAMVFGGVETERLELNEDTLWSGGPRDGNRPEARKVLPDIRKLLQEGCFAEADRLGKEMMGPYNQSYMPLGDLQLTFEHGNLADSSTLIESADPYRRVLDMESGLVSVEYRIGQTVYTREFFCSYPDQAIVIRLHASQPGKLNFSAMFGSKLHHRTRWDGNDLVLQGLCPEHVDPSFYDGLSG